jgi:hypothetical protein
VLNFQIDCRKVLLGKLFNWRQLKAIKVKLKLLQPERCEKENASKITSARQKEGDQNFL